MGEGGFRVWLVRVFLERSRKRFGRNGLEGKVGVGFENGKEEEVFWGRK